MTLYNGHGESGARESRGSPLRNAHPTVSATSCSCRWWPTPSAATRFQGTPVTSVSTSRRVVRVTACIGKGGRGSRSGDNNGSDNSKIHVFSPLQNAEPHRATPLRYILESRL